MEIKRTLIIEQILRFGLALLFLWAGAAKILSPVDFIQTIESYQLISYSFSVFFAYFIPILEILCGLSILFNKIDLGASMILLLMMLFFIAAMLQAWIRGLDITCGCFGKSSAQNRSQYLWWIIRDTVILSALVLFIKNRLENNTNGCTIILLRKKSLWSIFFEPKSEQNR